MNTVIFACVHNAGRSQMAAAFFNQLADHSVVESSGRRLPINAFRINWAFDRKEQLQRIYLTLEYLGQPLSATREQFKLSGKLHVLPAQRGGLICQRVD